MRMIVTVIGVLLILLGIVTLSYKGIQYTTQEKIAEIGDFKLTQEREKVVTFPPILGGLAIGVGIILVIVGRMSKPK